ncbi:MAG: superoxide dismutase family protein [Methyloceanibacter sp.]|jgi:superoxide dismutase, Cu-Zn family
MRIKAHWLAASILSVLTLSAPAYAADKAQATLKDASDREVGHATLFGTTGGVLISLDLTAVPPGDRAFHIHAVGKCEPPKFESAGPHFNPEQHSHGVMNPKGPHAGDMPNLHVPESGTLQIEVLNTTVAISESSLLDADGSAIVIHAGPDDYKTDPAGNAGDRIACGVITP